MSAPTPRRPQWAAMPGQPIRPRLGREPANPFAFRNRTHGKGYDTWASPSQDESDHWKTQPRDEGRFAETGTSKAPMHQTTRAKKHKHAEAESKAQASGEAWAKMSQAERGKWFDAHPGKARILTRVNAPPYDEPHMITESRDGTFKVKKEVEHYGGSQDPYFTYHWKTVGEFDTREAADKELAKRTDPEQLRQQQEAREAERQRKWEAGAPQRAKAEAQRKAKEEAQAAAREASKREMTPELSALEAVKEQLNQRDREFAESLIEQHKYGRNPLSERQTPWVKTLTERAETPTDTAAIQKVDDFANLHLHLNQRDADAAQSIRDYVRERGRFASEKQERYFDTLTKRARRATGDAAMTWQSPSQANDWDSEWRPPGWGSPSQDREFAEHKVNRDQAGKFAHQRQLHHARDKHWKSPRQDAPTASERNLIEDARIKAMDIARQILGQDTYRGVRIAGDSTFGMAFDRALVGRTLKSQIVRMAMDFTSHRTFSADGHLHVTDNRLSRASVNPYLGREIPGSEEMGLLPNQKYMLLRHPDELAQGVSSFNGLPVLIDHRPISADDHPSDLVVGSTGTDAKWMPPFLTNSLHIWDQRAIDAITKGERREISCAYHYDADMTPGVYEGKKFDGIMRNIHGNHVALVPDGRVGPVAVVADEMPLDLRISEFFA